MKNFILLLLLLMSLSQADEFDMFDEIVKAVYLNLNKNEKNYQID
jgi:hypothetical protein